MTIRSIHYYWLLICLITLLPVSLNAQESDQTAMDFNRMKDYFDHSYGPDYNLWNGKKYHKLHIKTIDHPFFNSDQFRKGSLLINGVRYEDVLINYDICNQHVILQYPGLSGGIEQIILTGEFIDEFTIDGKFFRKLSFPETGTRFFQIVDTDELSFYLYWEKDLVYNSTSLSTAYSFTSQSRKPYLLISGQLKSFISTSSLIDIFGKQFKKEIRSYIRQHQIYIREASEESLGMLIDYCTSLTHDK